MDEQKLPETGTVSESAPKNEEKRYLFDLKPIDGIFAVLFIMLGWIYYSSLSYILDTGIMLFIFAVLYAALISCFANTKGHKATKESYFWLAILLGLSISKVLYLNLAFNGIDALATHLVAVYWAMSRTGALIEGKIGKWVWLEGLRGLFYHPFRCFFAPFIAVKRSILSLNKKTVKKSLLMEIGLGALILVPVLMIILPSLFAADQGFALMFKNVFNWHINGRLASKLFIGAICGCYFFSLAFSCAGFCHSGFNKSCKESEKKAMILPVNSIKIVFYAVSAIYLVFVINALSSASQLVVNGLPNGHTYSSYARDGFFEMCWVCAFTLLLIGAAVWTAKEGWHQSFHLRLASVFLSICSLGLIGTAQAKMFMYISKQGLTPLRFFTTVFMLFLLSVFVLVIISTKCKINVAGISARIFAVCFTVITLINVSGIISSYNTARYMNGSLQNETLAGVGFYKTSDEIMSQTALFNSLPEGHPHKDALGYQLYTMHKSIENGPSLYRLTLSSAVAYYTTSGYERYADYYS